MAAVTANPRSFLARALFVGGHPADRRFMHRDGVGDGLEIERPQCLDAVHQEAVLLANDLPGHRQDGAGPLVEAPQQPIGDISIS